MYPIESSTKMIKNMSYISQIADLILFCKKKIDDITQKISLTSKIISFHLDIFQNLKKMFAETYVKLHKYRLMKVSASEMLKIIFKTYFAR